MNLHRNTSTEQPRRHWLSRHKLLSLTSLSIMAFLSFALITQASQGRVVASTFDQNDWSGGTGTGSDQYESKQNIIADSNLIAPGVGTVSNWCNTGDCDGNWLRRQTVWVHTSSDGGTTDQAIMLSIPHAAEMNSDFSDLRFTDASGTSLPYYILDKTDGDQARVWVKLPSTGAGDTTTVYMYYDNSVATSTSTTSAVEFEDGFDNGNIDNWDNPSGTVSVSDGFALLDPTAGGAGSVIQSKNTYDPEVTGKVLQFDVVFDGKSCANNYGFSMGQIVNSQYYVFGPANGIDCDNYTGLATHQGGTVGGGSSANTIPLTGATFRVYTSTSGAHSFAYSFDHGKTFQDVGNYDPTSESAFDPFNVLFSSASGSSGNLKIGNVTITNWTNPQTYNFGPVEHQGGNTGTITSRIFDSGGPAHYGNITYDITGSGDYFVQVRTSNSSDMSTASAWEYCPHLNSGDSIVSSCAHNGDRYAQYRVTLAQDNGGDLSLNSLTLNYTMDNVPPTNVSNLVMHRDTDSGRVVANNGWVNQLPYVGWDAASDSGGSGLAGYCLYVGTDTNPDLSTTSGNLTANDAVGTNGQCQFSTSDTHLPSNPPLSSALVTGTTYHVIVEAIDNFGNVGEPVSTSFRYDNVKPTVNSLYSYPVVVGSKIFSVTWLTFPGTGIVDSDSGPAGIKYCVTNALLGFGGCTPGTDNNFYGLAHSSGDASDTTDVVPFSNGEITTVPADASRLDDAVAFANGVTLIAVDQAGNYQTIANSIVIITHAAENAPDNLQVTPTSNSSNAFAFTWDPPGTHIDSTSNLDYCWTVNESIASDGSNCTWTGKGITQLATGPYATQQGTNTFYIATKDSSGNFDASKFASITFTAATTAPGAPRNLDISDVSIRDTSTWKLALTWDAPSLPGSGVHNYKIYRSTDGTSFTPVGSTSSANTSFIDSGLSQTTYYYKVQACDDANSCSVFSSTVSKYPTGRFTSPARLTADSDQPKVKDVGTKTATIQWFTDRNSDSKVAYGTSPGHYNPEEVGNSNQVASHSVTLSHLQPDTTYYYQARWTDIDGNTGHSMERSFTTAPPPTIGEVSATHITVSTADISFKSKFASKVLVEYGQTDNFGGFTSINTAQTESSYTIPLTNLLDGTAYVFRISGEDQFGNVYPGNTYNFSTPALPHITNLRFQPVPGQPTSTMKVTWQTNVPSSSQISFNPNKGKKLEVLDPKLVTDHAVTITNLADDTQYKLVATSIDKGGNAAKSDTQTFHTALDTRPPKISGVAVETAVQNDGNNSSGQLIVSWQTDEPSTSQVAYGQGESGSLTSRTSVDTRLTYNHTVIVSDLPTSTIFHLSVVSDDKANNEAISPSITAIIGRGTDNVFTIIFNALQNIFGISH